MTYPLPEPVKKFEVPNLQFLYFCLVNSCIILWENAIGPQKGKFTHLVLLVKVYAGDLTIQDLYLIDDLCWESFWLYKWFFFPSSFLFKNELVICIVQKTLFKTFAFVWYQWTFKWWVYGQVETSIFKVTIKDYSGKGHFKLLYVNFFISSQTELHLFNLKTSKSISLMHPIQTGKPKIASIVSFLATCYFD